MRLYEIIEKEKIKFKKILIPSNSGYKGMIPDPLDELGIPDKPGDSFTLELVIPKKPGYIFASKKLEIEVKRLRAEDIPQSCVEYTDGGIAVLGLTGDDVYDEYLGRNPQIDPELRMVDTIDWHVEEVKEKHPRFHRPTLCLIGVKGSRYGDFPPQSTVVFDRKFESTARYHLQRFETDFGVKFEVIIQSGKIENAIPDLAAYGVDIVLTGDTLIYSNKDAQTPRDPPLTVLKYLRGSDISVITSWPKPKKKTKHTNPEDAQK